MLLQNNHRERRGGLATPGGNEIVFPRGVDANDEIELRITFNREKTNRGEFEAVVMREVRAGNYLLALHRDPDITLRHESLDVGNPVADFERAVRRLFEVPPAVSGVVLNCGVVHNLSSK